MIFLDTNIDEKNKFSIGIEKESGEYYLSIPVSNPFVDYSEYYKISRHSYKSYSQNMDLALDFLDQCKKRNKDHLLFQQPGKYRGSPI